MCIEIEVRSLAFVVACSSIYGEVIQELIKSPSKVHFKHFSSNSFLTYIQNFWKFMV